MAKVRACQVLEAIEDGEVTKPSNSATPGVVIKIVNQTVPSVPPPTIDITPEREADQSDLHRFCRQLVNRAISADLCSNDRYFQIDHW
jgi:hypothetical protein